MAKVTIDGIEVEVPDGTTILNAARKIGGELVPPAMCYYTSLKDSGGKCRVCLVKVAQGSTKDPRPMPKLVASCRTPVMDGMVVQSRTSPEVLESRKAVVEFLLINHPLIVLSATRQVNAIFRILPTSTAQLRPVMKKTGERLKKLTSAIRSSFT